jgi:hypothetical protein
LFWAGDSGSLGSAKAPPPCAVLIPHPARCPSCSRPSPSSVDNSTCDKAFEVPVSSTNVSPFTYVNARFFPNIAPAPVTTCSGTAEPGHRLVQIHGVRPPRTGCVQRTTTVDARTLEVLGGSCGSLTSLQCLIADSPYLTKRHRAYGGCGVLHPLHGRWLGMETGRTWAWPWCPPRPTMSAQEPLNSRCVQRRWCNAP